MEEWKEEGREKSASELERERMQDLEDRIERNIKKSHHPVVNALSGIAIPLSYTILTGVILSLIVHTFMSSLELGIRGLVVAILPPIVATYFALFKRLFRHPKHIRKMPLYFASVGWIVMSLACIRFLVNHPSISPNWGVLLLSTTLSSLIFSRRYISFGAALSCAYGVITGLMVYVALFGFVIH